MSTLMGNRSASIGRTETNEGEKAECSHASDENIFAFEHNFVQPICGGEKTCKTVEAHQYGLKNCGRSKENTVLMQEI